MSDYPLYPETGSHHDTPASRVEEVLARIKGVKHNVGNEPRTYYLAEQADLDALIAAVREDTLAKVRAIPDTMLIVPSGPRDFADGWEAAVAEFMSALADLAEGKP